MTEYARKQSLKAYYIPLCCEKKITEVKCAQIIGITPYSVSRLKKRYRKEGKAIFTNGHKGKKYGRTKYPDSFNDKIINIYRKNWDGTSFKTFCECLEDYHNIIIEYKVLLRIMKRAGIKPPRFWTLKEKEEHKSRPEREQSGELIQMDASKHDWFTNGNYVTLHGGIDDSTHTVTGLYFCLNECRLGYNEVLRQTWIDYGIPKAYYIDRHSSFVENGKKEKPLIERIENAKNESTHFIDLCRELNIAVILALSPQAKGRIERLWQTLQGKLPPIFKFLGIDTLEAANCFVTEWLKRFNSRYSKKPRNKNTAYKAIPQGFDINYKLSVKFSCRTDCSGGFVFHDCDFILDAPARSYKKFELCLSESFGIKAYMDGKWYPVRLRDRIIMDVCNDKMPQVEKRLIEKYLLRNIHTDIA